MKLTQTLHEATTVSTTIPEVKKFIAQGKKIINKHLGAKRDKMTQSWSEETMDKVSIKVPVFKVKLGDAIGYKSTSQREDELTKAIRSGMPDAKVVPTKQFEFMVMLKAPIIRGLAKSQIAQTRINDIDKEIAQLQKEKARLEKEVK